MSMSNYRKHEVTEFEGQYLVISCFLFVLVSTCFNRKPAGNARVAHKAELTRKLFSFLGSDKTDYERDFVSVDSH